MGRIYPRHRRYRPGSGWTDPGTAIANARNISGRSSSSPAPVPLPENVPPAATGLAIVPVFFATDRARVAGSPAVTYGTARNPSGDLALGKFEVSIPRDHRFGSLERPDIWTFWREDPTKHLVITSRVQQSYDQFYTDV